MTRFYETNEHIFLVDFNKIVETVDGGEFTPIFTLINEEEICLALIKKDNIENIFNCSNQCDENSPIKQLISSLKNLHSILEGGFCELVKAEETKTTTYLKWSFRFCQEFESHYNEEINLIESEYIDLFTFKTDIEIGVNMEKDKWYISGHSDMFVLDNITLTEINEMTNYGAFKAYREAVRAESCFTKLTKEDVNFIEGI